MDIKKTIGNTLIASAIGVVIMRLNKEKLVYIDKLPSFINTYIKTHFASHRLSKVIKNRKGLNYTYDVFLDGGLSLKFNSKGKVIEIEGNGRLPDSVIPASILEYVNLNFPDNAITEWELEKRIQEVELDSGVELLFNLKGEFIGMDF